MLLAGRLFLVVGPRLTQRLLRAGGIRAITVSTAQSNATDSGFRVAKPGFCGVID
jgi:hypothetical protein